MVNEILKTKMDVLRTFLNSILRNLNKNDLIKRKLAKETNSLDEVFEISNLLLQECDQCVSNLNSDDLFVILKTLAQEQPYMDNIFEDIIISSNLEVMNDKQIFLNHHLINECHEPHGDIFLTIINSSFFEEVEEFNFETILHEKVYEIQETTAKFLRIKSVNDNFRNSKWINQYRNFVSVKAYQIIMYEKIKFNIPDVVTNSACFTCEPQIVYYF